jgi:cell division protein FtsX
VTGTEGNGPQDPAAREAGAFGARRQKSGEHGAPAERRRLVEWVGSLLFCGASFLLPGWLRARAGSEMLLVFDERQRNELNQAGTAALLVLWGKELGGLLRASARARSTTFVPREPQLDPSSKRPPRARANLLQDLRFAVRTMARKPAFTALAVMTLALGIGASSAMFSVVDTVLMWPLPYRDPATLVTVYPTIPEWESHPMLGRLWDRAAWSHPEYVDWRELQTSFESGALYALSSATLTGDGTPERLRAGRVTYELFPILEVVPQLGRLFGPEDDNRTGERVVLLSDGFWRRRFGADERIVGASVTLDGEPHTIIGVLPADFRFRIGSPGSFSDNSRYPEIWLPVGGPADPAYRRNHSFQMLGRLRPGVTLERATEETARILQETNPPDHIRHGANVVPRQLDETRDIRLPLAVLMVAVVILLLVACGNVATILLGHAIDREREIAIRGALGAGRRRIASQLLTESLVLAALGGAAGLLLAYWVMRLLVYLAPASLPRLDEVALDLRVVAFGVAVSAVTGLLFGLLPALTLARTDLAHSITAARLGSSSRTRMQKIMATAEVALATVLLVGAGLLARSFLALNAVDPGFEASNLLVVQVRPEWTRFDRAAQAAVAADRQATESARQAAAAERETSTRQVGGEATDEDLAAALREARAVAFHNYFDELNESIAALPGLEAVVLTSSLPYTGAHSDSEIEPEGYTPEEGELLSASWHGVSPNYFRTLRIPILEGRSLEPSDDRVDAAPVVVVNETLARSFWPAGAAVGKRIDFWGRLCTIVGVAADIRYEDLGRDPDMQLFLPRRQWDFQGIGFLIRAAADPAGSIAAVRAAVWEVDPDLPITIAAPMSELMAHSLADARYRTRLIVVFAALAATFAILGIYGVSNRAVAARTREIGIRVALGAERRRVMSMVMGQGLRLAAAGAAIGIVLSLALTRVLQSFLYNVEATDPWTLVAIGVLITLLSQLACLAPSLRAARSDPMVALRTD